jgi:hypothetical protein
VDEMLAELVKSGESEKGNTAIKVLDLAGDLEVKTPEGMHPYKLKPLPELYGPGINADTFDPASEEYLPLCMAIESEILNAGRNTRPLPMAKSPSPWIGWPLPPKRTRAVTGCCCTCSGPCVSN